MGKCGYCRGKTVSRCEMGATGWESVGTGGENCEQVRVGGYRVGKCWY